MLDDDSSIPVNGDEVGRKGDLWDNKPSSDGLSKKTTAFWD